MDKLIERIAGARKAVKVGVVVALAVLVTVVNYLVIGIGTFAAPIDAVEKRIEKVRGEQKKLDVEYAEKQAIANNLNEFRREKEALEQRLRDALAELPEDKNVDELLHDFQERAIKAGLEIQTIEPQAAVSEGFYARLPIPMSVQGDYHEVATFLDAVGRMKRIVNVSNISFDQPKDHNGRLVLTAKFLATSFMFVTPSEPKAGAPAGAKAAPKAQGSKP